MFSFPATHTITDAQSWANKYLLHSPVVYAAHNKNANDEKQNDAENTDNDDDVDAPGHRPPVLLLVSALAASDQHQEVIILEVRRGRRWGHGVVTEIFLTPVLTRHLDCLDVSPLMSPASLMQPPMSRAGQPGSCGQPDPWGNRDKLRQPGWGREGGRIA